MFLSPLLDFLEWRTAKTAAWHHVTWFHLCKHKAEKITCCVSFFLPTKAPQRPLRHPKPNSEHNAAKNFTLRLHCDRLSCCTLCSSHQANEKAEKWADTLIYELSAQFKGSRRTYAGSTPWKKVSDERIRHAVLCPLAENFIKPGKKKVIENVISAGGQFPRKSLPCEWNVHKAGADFTSRSETRSKRGKIKQDKRF